MIERLDRMLTAAHEHPLLTDAIIAAALTAVLLAIAPGTAVVGIALLLLALLAGAGLVLRRRRAARRTRI
jgi:hypothetical protein